MTGTIDPALFGMPNAATAGVPPGTTLTAYTGPMTITKDGTVIEGKIIDGTLTIDAANVTIKNCIIKNYGMWGIDGEGASNLSVLYCDFTASTSKDTNAAILGSGTFIGNDISQSENGIVLQGGASVVRDNYIHDLFDNFGEPHIDGISVQGGQNNVLIEHNTIESWDTSAVFIKNDFGPINNVTVRNNLMYADADRGDPAATVYVYGPNTTNVSIVDNYVEKGHWFYYSTSNANPTISGNIEWDNKTDPTPYPASAPTQPSTPSAPSTPSTPSAPSAPTIASFSNDTGKAGDGITSDNTLQLKGAAAAGSTIKIYDGSTQIGTTTASSTGSWEYITSVLSNAKHVLTATATSSSGQTSAASGAMAVTVDTVAPTAPVLSSNALVNTNQVKLSGTAEASSAVTIYDGNTVVGTGTTNSAGTWSITTNALSTGTHALTAKAADAAGNVSSASQSVSSVIGGTSPTTPAPTPGKEVESSGATTLVESGDKYYLNGSSGSGPTLKYGGRDFIDGTDGTWSPIGAEKTATGYLVAWKEASTGQYTAWNTDSNGNYVSHVNTLTGSVSGGSVSGTSSALKSIEKSFQQDLNGDGHVGASSGAAPTSSVDLTTMDKSWSGVVTIKGAADANSQVKLYDGNTSLGTVSTAADGSWSFKTSSAISDTVHTYTAKQIDGAGQVVGTSGNAILGSTSNNELKGTSGNDLFTGNGGNDTFVFAANFGNDIIKDFGASSRSHDVIQFSKSVFDNFADVLAHAAQVGRDVVISADAGDSVTLKNTKLSAISSNDFHFA
jgi:hypothetical protein